MSEVSKNGDGPWELPKRILIYGVTGSGKTTMAKWLSEHTGIAWKEIDTLTWEPGWVVVPLDIQRERINAICDRDEWIMDAAYGKWIDIPLERVQLVIGLDYSRARSFWQLFKRCVARGIDKKEICNGNVESFKNMFSKESILLWHVKSFSSKRKRMRSWKADRSQFEVILFKKPSELGRWKSQLIDAKMHS